MISATFRRALAFALTLALFACDKPIADKEVLFGAIHEHIHALEKKDVETVMATIHPDSPQLEEMREGATLMFKTVDAKFTLSDLRIESATPEEVKVSYSEKMEFLGGQQKFVDNIVEGVFTLRPDKGRWKIYKTLATKITDLKGKPLVTAPEPTTTTAPERPAPPPSAPAPATPAPPAK